LLTEDQRAALAGTGQYSYSPAQSQLQSQLQAIADRNRDRQQLGLPTRPVPGSMGYKNIGAGGDMGLLFAIMLGFAGM
jgi:hypothetical protein